MSLQIALAALANPQTPAPVLADIANNYPQLHPQIVDHPAVYPELLQWIATTSPDEHARMNAAKLLGPRVSTAPQPPEIADHSPKTPTQSPEASEVPEASSPVVQPTAQSGSESDKTKEDERPGTRKRRKRWPILVASLLVAAVAVSAFFYFRPNSQGVLLNRLAITGEPIHLGTLESAPESAGSYLYADPVERYFAHTVYDLEARVPDRTTIYTLERGTAAPLDLPPELILPSDYGRPSADSSPQLMHLYGGVATYECQVESTEADRAYSVFSFVDLKKQQSMSVAAAEYGTEDWAFSRGPGKNYVVTNNYSEASVSLYKDSDTAVWQSEAFTAPSTSSGEPKFEMSLADDQLIMRYVEEADWESETPSKTTTAVVDLTSGDLHEIAHDPEKQFGAVVWPEEGSYRWTCDSSGEDCTAELGPPELDKPATSSLSYISQWAGWYPGPRSFAGMSSITSSLSFTDLQSAAPQLEEINWRSFTEPSDKELIQILPGGVAKLGVVESTNLFGGWHLVPEDQSDWSEIPQDCMISTYLDSGNTVICAVNDAQEITGVKAFRKGSDEPIFEKNADFEDQLEYHLLRIGLDDWVLQVGEDLDLLR